LLGSKSYPFKKILVVKLDEIGDVVTSLHVFYNLHDLYPNAKITLLCRPFNNAFFTHLDYVACVSSVAELDSTYDLVVELRGNDKTLKYIRTHKPKYLLDRGSIRFKNKFLGGQKNEIDTNLEVIQPLLKDSGILDNRIVLSNQEHLTIKSFIDEENIAPFVVLHIGARSEARRWPIERFASCIEYINTEYGMACILVGGDADKELNNQCLALVKNKRNMNIAGQFNLLEFAALCERATLFLGNESGPVHIASAQKTPIIALFGPGVRKVFYPRGEKVKIHHYFLARGHKSQTLENSTIFSITIDEVKKSIDGLLQ
jgi:heptosyltransferase-3